MTTKITEKNISSLANAGVSWQSVIVADGSTGTTGVAGRGYFINTTSAAHTFTLPATATFADTILIKDYAGTFGTNALTIARNGHNIQGAANNSEIGTNRASVTLVYVDVTRGWEFVTESNVADLGAPVFTSATGGTITTSGDFKIHSFTGDGCFVVSQLGNAPTQPTGGPTSVDYLVVAGGGGGGGGRGGGGGAGGYRLSSGTNSGCYSVPSPLASGVPSISVTTTTYPITVGGGGVGQEPVSNTNGNPSTFSTITSAGGGAAGAPGSAGGSGGGTIGVAYSSASGNTPPTNPPQGNASGAAPPSTNYTASGGGGAGSAGSNSTSPTGGPGGNGSANSITGSSVTYAGGGGGGGIQNPQPGCISASSNGSGGPGGGGNATFAGGISGSANTGGGGGGAGATPAGAPVDKGGSGGSGIVIIRYKFQ